MKVIVIGRKGTSQFLIGTVNSIIGATKETLKLKSQFLIGTVNMGVLVPLILVQFWSQFLIGTVNDTNTNVIVEEIPVARLNSL